MQVSIPVKCGSCGALGNQTILVDKSSFDWTCSSCGQGHSIFLSLDLTIGFLLKERSLQELQKADYSLSIALAAVALDAELSRLYTKWMHIADLRAGRDFDSEKCDKGLKKLKFIPKLNAVAMMLYPTGLEGFVRDSAELSATIDNNFPSLHRGSLAQDFHRTVFKPRNEIMHQGVVTYGKQDAERCLSIASLGLDIYLEMDIAKRKQL